MARYCSFVCKGLLDVENTSEPSMMFEEGDLIEMQPSLVVNKLACMHLPVFTLRSGRTSVVAVSSRLIKRRKIVRLATTQPPHRLKMPNSHKRYSSSLCSSQSDNTVNIWAPGRDANNNLEMISYQQHAMLRHDLASRNQVIHFTPVCCFCFVHSSSIA
jgi:hypothetical protein